MHQPPPYGPYVTAPIGAAPGFGGPLTTDDPSPFVSVAPSRFVKRGAYMVCLSCDLTSMYCRCSERMRDAPPEDGPAAASLAQRIKERNGTR